jgi:NADH-quinone oxidoreductase subunit L
MWRLFFKTFCGESRAPADVRDHVREPSGWVVKPLWLLAIASLFGGVIGIPQVYGDWLHVDPSHSLNTFLSPMLVAGESRHIEHSTEYGLALGAIGMFVIGLVGAWWLILKRPEISDLLARRLAGFYRLSFNKYWVDEIYDAAIVRPLVWLSDSVLYRRLDAGFVDSGLVNGTARGIRAVAADGLKYLQSGLAQGYIFMMIVGTMALIGYLLR